MGSICKEVIGGKFAKGLAFLVVGPMCNCEQVRECNYFFGESVSGVCRVSF